MVNSVFIMGNLTRDPELKYLPSGSAVCNFSIAVNDKYKGGDGKMVEKVHYFNVAAFGKTAENCGEYLSKGRKVLIQGKLEQQRWEKDGKNHSAVKINTMIVNFLDGKGGNKGGSRPSDDEEVGY